MPALLLDDGEPLTEGAAIMQHLADLAPESGLAPPAGSRERYRLQEWLGFIGAELHKMFSPWLFHPEHGEQAQQVARARIADRLAFIDHHLVGRDWLVGDGFTAADAYAFTIVGWARPLRIELEACPALRGYMTRIAARPKVREALRAEGVEAAR